MGRVRMLDAGPESDTGAGIWETPAETVITLADGRLSGLVLKDGRLAEFRPEFAYQPQTPPQQEQIA